METKTMMTSFSINEILKQDVHLVQFDSVFSKPF